MTDAEFISGLLRSTEEALHANLARWSAAPQCQPWCDTTNRLDAGDATVFPREAEPWVVEPMRFMCSPMCRDDKRPIRPVPPCPDCGKATTSVIHKSVCLAPCRVASRGK